MGDGLDSPQTFMTTKVPAVLKTEIVLMKMKNILKLGAGQKGLLFYCYCFMKPFQKTY